MEPIAFRRAACLPPAEISGASELDATMPVFDGGTLWFGRQAAIDNYQQAMALYRQTVLGAFGQVADTLRAS